MKIISLRAENVKRLKAVEIVPDGDVVVIAGRNAQGKSSVLDAIWMALAGAAGAKETSRAIRDGEEKASVVLDLGDMVVTRKWTDAGTTLEVRAQDGARYPSPQAVLDGLIGRLAFDPLAFAEQDAKGQRDTLLSVVELPFEPAEMDALRAGVFEDRTDVNREVKRLEAQIAGIPKPLPTTPDAELSAAEIAAELQAATDAAHERTEAERKLEDAQAALTTASALVASAQRAHDEATKVQAAAAMDLSQLPALVDTAPIKARLEAIDDTNAAVRAKQERARLTVQLEASRARSAELTEKLQGIDGIKAEAVAAAKMPLDGLSFDEDGVLYNDVPFSQASSAERLRVGIAMAMALNPTIRVIRIADGSLLDSENLALIEQMAGEHDFQIWVERVDESGEVGITIEDGEVVER